MKPRRPAGQSLKQFALWWLRHKPFEVPPALDSIHQVGQYTGVTLYRAAPFQVQLFIGAAGAKVTPHAHPNFESLECWVVRNGPEDRGTYWTASGKHVSGMLHIDIGEAHHAVAGPHGVCFLSIQRWRDGVPIISGHLDWNGVPMDGLQAETLNKDNPYG